MDSSLRNGSYPMHSPGVELSYRKMYNFFFPITSLCVIPSPNSRDIFIITILNNFAIFLISIDTQ